MSQISKALKKIQEIRFNSMKKPGDIVYLTDTPEIWPKTVLRIILVVSVAVAIFMSIVAIILTLKSTETKQFEVVTLKKTIKAQDKRINDLITSINKNQLAMDGQIQDLNDRLKQNNAGIKVQIDNSTSAGEAHYTDLKEAILDDKEEINSLVKYTKILNQKIEELSAKESQAKDLANPVSGN
jgi:hypothetical protein